MITCGLEKEILTSAGNIQARLCMARCLVEYVGNVINENEKRYWAIEKPKLHTARKLRAISYFDPKGTEFKGNHEKECAQSFGNDNGIRKALQHFSISTERLGAHNTILENQDTLLRLKPTNRRERALGRLNPEIMKISLLRRRSIHCVIIILYTRFIPILQAMKKIRDATAALDKVWEKLEKLLAWQVTEVLIEK